LAILSIFLWRRWVVGPLVALGIMSSFSEAIHHQPFLAGTED
jgi:hypothetical protein